MECINILQKFKLVSQNEINVTLQYQATPRLEEGHGPSLSIKYGCDSSFKHSVSINFFLFYLFSPFYWAGFVAQRERAQQDFKVPYKVPHLTHPPFTYERQPQHRDHPTFIRIVRGFFNVPQNYQHSRIMRRDLRFIVLVRED